MKRIVLFDTSQGTLNLGDFIINECLEDEMKFLLDNQNVVRFSTHLPISRWYQTFRKNIIYKTCNSADFKFLCGTNLFKNSLIRISPDWNINFTSVEYYKNSIAIGCGMDMNSKSSDPYTRYIYKHILSKDFIHSVRDERTRLFLEGLGFKAINTGCPTLWGLSKEVCQRIPTTKSQNVIFTLTDYKRDIEADKKLISILKRNYSELRYWIQGYDDYEYLKSLTDIRNIKIIPYSLQAYKEALAQPNTDYVGTRLHAGIYAMRHQVRSIILSVDNRADDMVQTYNLPVVKRSNIEIELEPKINSDFNTQIELPLEEIELWKGQFR